MTRRVTHFGVYVEFVPKPPIVAQAAAASNTATAWLRPDDIPEPIFYVDCQQGDDANDGLSVATAWETIQHAIDSMYPGDTVYIAPGHYRERLTIDGLHGSEAAPFRLIGDVTGQVFGRAGLVYISPFSLLSLDDFILEEFNGQEPVQPGVLTVAHASHWLLEGLYLISGGYSHSAFPVWNATFCDCAGITVRRCTFYHNGPTETASDFLSALAVQQVNRPATPLVFDACTLIGDVIFFYGSIPRNYDDMDDMEPPGVSIDYNTYFTNCIWMTFRAAAFIYAGGGVHLHFCTLWQRYEPLRLNTASTAHPRCSVINCVGINAETEFSPVPTTWAEESQVDSHHNLLLSSVTRLMREEPHHHDEAIFGGLGDLTYYKDRGQSPYRMFEPIVEGNYQNVAAAMAASAVTTDHDFYGNPRGMSGTCEVYAYADGHLGIVNHNNAWVYPQDVANPHRGYTAICFTDGSVTANYLQLSGVHSYGDTGTIVRVYARSVMTSSADAAVMGVEVATPGRARILAIWAHFVPQQQVAAGARISPWTLLAPPPGGWSWEALASLETRLWKADGTMAVAANIDFVCVVRGATSVGAVQAINQPVVDSDLTYGDLSTIRFDGPGVYEVIKPVRRGQALASVMVQTGNGYAGDPPVLEVLAVPGAADQRLAMAGSPGVWNEIQIPLTVGRDGFVRLRVISYDTSTSGTCHFADLEVIRSS